VELFGTVERLEKFVEAKKRKRAQTDMKGSNRSGKPKKNRERGGRRVGEKNSKTRLGFCKEKERRVQEAIHNRKKRKPFYRKAGVEILSNCAGKRGKHL